MVDFEGGFFVLILTSPQFHDGDFIPARFTGVGQNISPPLRWSGLPKNTLELALICDDPDAPGPQPWVHWVIYQISPIGNKELPPGVLQKPTVVQPLSAVQGVNSFGDYGYGGPLPPIGHGTHRYFFKLYALSQKINLKPGLNKEQLLEKISPHVIAETQLMGRFERVQSTARAG
jgi:Raf kinase inhibitor-like YbhB/YbcL family protein